MHRSAPRSRAFSVGYDASPPALARIARLVLRAGLLVSMVSVPAFKTAAAAAKPVDFTRDVRPILSEHCFTCHGPDDQKRKAKYRVDTKDGAYQSAEGKALIVPGKPGESEFFRRLTTTDEDDLMPPAKTGRKLTEPQVAILRRWIESGASWNEHWAFISPRRPAEPDVKNASWVRQPIDRFVAARLDAEGLEPSPEAARPELLRRATLDLTGLPPTPEELDAFLADTSSDAYDKVVDRLLKSPRYGENMARHWLDAVRYADTHGYHIDSQRDIWAYREWVIKAFNRNQPFDQFTTEQLAGDLLPDPTLDQKIATGFLRCNMSTGEGGVIEAEYAAKYAFDRVETLGTVYLGVTLICSRCHSHKYDPLPANEYYGVYSFFNNLAEPVMDGNKPNPEPFLRLPTPEQSARLEALTQQISDTERKLAAPDQDLDAKQLAWTDRIHRQVREQLAMLQPASASAKVTDGTRLRLDDDGSLAPASGGARSSQYDANWKLAAGPLAALRLEVFGTAAETPQESSRYGISEIEAELLVCKDGKCEPRPLKFAKVQADASDPAHPASHAIDAKADTAWAPPTASTRDAHALFLVLQEPVDVPEDSQLHLRLRQETEGLGNPMPRFRVTAARQRDLVQQLFPPRPKPWRTIGPFPVEDQAAALAASHEAEKDPASTKGFPGVRGDVRWSDANDIQNGKSHLLVHDIHGVHGVRYLHRLLASSQSREAEVSLRTEGWYKLWVNGALVAEKAADTAASDGAHRVRVPLKAGDNDVLVKVVSVNGTTTYFFDIDPGTDITPPPEVLAVLAATP
ncbi:MAG: DUF1549 domain-containing protein, partial [Nitrospira sp.]|nr:DUF1549 domain-containing protein [Nitrospira sp.]